MLKKTLIAALCCIASLGYTSQEAPGILGNEWISFALQGHSSSITKTEDSFLIVTNGRLHKDDPRSVLVIQKSPDGRWAEPKILKTPGEFSPDPRAFVTSPIVCKVFPSAPSSKDYFLFFRVGPCYETKLLQSCAFRSTDGGLTFTRFVLPEGFIGPTKCKPLYFGNYLVFGSSIERGDTSNKDGQSSTAARIEIYDIRTGNWHQSPELITEMSFGAIEPTFCTFEKEGETFIRMFCRNRSQGFALTTEFTLADNPEDIQWPVALENSTLPNCDSGLDLMDLSGKTIRGKTIASGTVIAFGNFLGRRTSLEMAASTDGGKTWSTPIVIDAHSGEFPACYFDDDSGLIHVTYASNKPNTPYAKENQTIRHLIMDPSNGLFESRPYSILHDAVIQSE